MIYETREFLQPLGLLLPIGDFIHMATGPKVQVFTASGTYTRNVGLVAACIECVGGGGAGGGVVNGTSGASSYRGGGGGGATALGDGSFAGGNGGSGIVIITEFIA